MTTFNFLTKQYIISGGWGGHWYRDKCAILSSCTVCVQGWDYCRRVGLRRTNDDLQFRYIQYAHSYAHRMYVHSMYTHTYIQYVLYIQ
jgi:hypothetical protein